MLNREKQDCAGLTFANLNAVPTLLAWMAIPHYHFLTERGDKESGSYYLPSSSVPVDLDDTAYRMGQVQGLITNRYQLADVLAGIGYTFIMTWVILYGLKVLRMIFRRTLAWGTGAGFEKLQKPERWKQEATPQYQWRKEAAAGSSPPAEQRPHAD